MTGTPEEQISELIPDGQGWAVDPIVTDTPTLRIPSRETSWEEVDGLNLPTRIKAALPTAWIKGFGLAACQIGIPVCYALITLDGEEIELLNPVITRGERPSLLRGEGCLSIPGRRYDTIRYGYIQYETDTRAAPEVKDEKGTVVRAASPGGRQMFEAFGIAAAVVQHELDHMAGKICIDRQQNPYPKLGRNDPCGCFSGKKYKKCCLK